MSEKQKVLSGRRTFGELSLDTKTICELLRKAEIGEIVSLQDMSKALGRDVRKVWSSTRSARHKLERDEGLAFCAVPGVGFKRETNSESAQVAAGIPHRVGRMVRRAIRRAAYVVNPDLLSNAERLAFHASVSQLGALAEFSKPHVQKRIESAQPSDSLPVGKVLELFHR